MMKFPWIIFGLFALIGVMPVSAQILPHTYIVEAYTCRCGADGKPTNSIQLGTRLDPSFTIHTALQPLIGCGRILLNVQGERFPVRITLANARDNVARLELIEMASNINELEKKLKKLPNYQVLGPVAEVGKPNVVILQGAGMSMQKRGLPEAQLLPTSRGGSAEYTFRMNDRSDADIDFNRLLGGPVWVEKGKDQLAGLITGYRRLAGQVEFTVTGVENVLYKQRFMLYHAYLAEHEEELEGCGDRQVYWDGFGAYKYKTPSKAKYKRITTKDKWDVALNDALLRIREHMRDSIPTKGNNREGEPSLCVFVNDLENVYLAFAEQSTATERNNWPVLPRFVKAYSNVFCKQRKYSDAEFSRDIIELNYWMDQIGSEELRLLYELHFDWGAFEGFVKRYYLLSQVSGIRKRFDGQMEDDGNTGDPCLQLEMLEELERFAADWAKHVGGAQDAHHEQLLLHRRALATTRDAMLNARMERLGTDRDNVPELLAGIEGDSCLTSGERLRLLKVAREQAVDHEREAIDYGIDVVESVRTSIATAFGEHTLSNVMTKVFRVENGVGVEITIRGGGAILDKRLYGKTGLASDTTTVYRHGFPLGSVGDTLSATIAQVFWDRMCADYASRKWEYRTESVEVIGMADGVPVRSTLRIAEECLQELARLGVKESNAQLAYARAWSLRQHLVHGDRCGLYDLLDPSITSRTYTERGGEYRGVTMRAVMKRK
jgi:hypothetical protein